MKKYIMISLLIIVIIVGAELIKFFLRVTERTELKSSLSTLKSDVDTIFIQNSSYYTYSIINGESGDDYDLKSIIILEESSRRHHPSIGWQTLAINLTAWEHQEGENLKIIWNVSAKSKCSVSWLLDTDTGCLTVTSFESTDGEDYQKFNYNAFTGNIVKKP